jgi:hypothetical protein
MSEEVAVKKEVRGKIILEYTGGGMPEVKFMGDVRARDVQMVKVAVQRAFRIYMLKAGRKQIKAFDASKAYDAEQAKVEEKATKGDTPDESRTTKPTESGSGNSEESSGGSGSDNKQRSGRDLQTPDSGRAGNGKGSSGTVQQKTGKDAVVVPKRTKDSKQDSGSKD